MPSRTHVNKNKSSHLARHFPNCFASMSSLSLTEAVTETQRGPGDRASVFSDIPNARGLSELKRCVSQLEGSSALLRVKGPTHTLWETPAGAPSLTPGPGLLLFHCLFWRESHCSSSRLLG